MLIWKIYHMWGGNKGAEFVNNKLVYKQTYKH